MDIATLRREWASKGQEGVFRFYDQLPEAGRRKLESQLAALDVEHLDRLAE